MRVRGASIRPARIHPPSRPNTSRNPNTAAALTAKFYDVAPEDPCDANFDAPERVRAELEPGGLVVETVGSGEHEDRHAVAGGDDACGDLVTGGPGNVSIEDGDVVGIDAQQLQSGGAVTCDVCRYRFQA